MPHTSNTGNITTNYLIPKLMTFLPRILNIRTGLLALALLLPAGTALIAAETPALSEQKVEVSLLTDAEAIAPGSSFWLGIRYRMDPHWHIYWKNYGDTGIPTEINWELPEGFTAGELQWPTPSTYIMGGLMNYVYEDEVILMARITAPEDLQPGSEIRMGAESHWLVCEDICIPGDAELELKLPVVERFEKDAAAAADLEAQQASWPQESDLWSVRGDRREQSVTLLIEPREPGLPSLEDLYFFSENSAIDPAAEQRVDTFEDGSYRMVLQVSPAFKDPLPPLPGVLKSSTGWEPGGTFLGLAVKPMDHVDSGESPLIETVTAPDEIGNRAVSPWQAAAFALLGGLILNLMPCVFPVLGLKVMGFVKQAGQDPAGIKRHGLVFTLGVLLSMWILVGVLLGLRAAGDIIGWGFQLQDPRFVAFIIFLFTAFGLNLAGVYEVGNRLVGSGADLSGKSGYSGSFFSGILAVIVATPCTAPFMGVAIGFALASPLWMTFLLFTLLGLGLALPYLLFSFYPAFLQRLPKPGPWMESFKQFMAFPLFATAVYFLWVYGTQTGLNASIDLLAGLLALGMGLWIYGRWAAPHRRPATRWIAISMAGILALAGIGYGMRVQWFPTVAGSEGGGTSEQSSTSNNTVQEHGVTWLPWSNEAVKEHREAGQTVYVDFTATWCLTCQANKKVVFGSKRVRDRFNDHADLVLLKADWTRRDPAISRALESFGRNGVPLNVIYPPEGEPILLPAALTPGIVMQALDRAGAPGQSTE